MRVAKRCAASTIDAASLGLFPLQQSGRLKSAEDADGKEGCHRSYGNVDQEHQRKDG
jgi:hypothetical protein